MDNWIIPVAVFALASVIGLLMRRSFNALERGFQTAAKQCLDRQALKRHGRFKSFGKWPVLTIPYQDVNIDVTVNYDDDTPGGEYTYATFKTDLVAHKQFAIYRKGLFVRPFLVIGSRLEISDEVFSKEYFVTGTDHIFVKQMLTEEIRNKLVGLSLLRVQFGPRHGAFTWSRESGWLTVMEMGVGTTDGPYDRVIETAFLFYDTLEALARSQSSQGLSRR